MAPLPRANPTARRREDGVVGLSGGAKEGGQCGGLLRRRRGGRGDATMKGGGERPAYEAGKATGGREAGWCGGPEVCA
jgi:hypothetical protein